MATVEELRLEIKASVADAVGKLKQYDRQTKETTSATKNMQSTFANMRDVMQGPVAAFNMISGAIGKVAGEVDKYIMLAAESEKNQAILNSTLQATGATAWTSAAALNEYASTMAELTLFEDDAITGMQGILLGFRNIQGVNFKRASTEILNMAQVMGMDLTSAAQAVGKALDNPIQGIDSLSRQGFKFSAAEKEVLKTLVETNRLAEAQDIILKELSKTYGGAAEAAANTATGAYLNMKKAMGEFNEEIGKAIANSSEWKKITAFVNSLAQSLGDVNKTKSLKQKIEELDQLMGTRGFSEKTQNAKLDAIAKIGLNSEGAAAGIAMLSGRIDENNKELKKWYNVANPTSGLVRATKNENKQLEQQRSELQKLLPWLNAVEDKKEEATQPGSSAPDNSGVIAGLKEEEEAVYNLVEAYKGQEQERADAFEKARQAQADYWASMEYEEADSAERRAEITKKWQEEFIEGEKKRQQAAMETANVLISSAQGVADEWLALEENKTDAAVRNLEKQRDAMQKNGEDTAAIDAKIQAKKNELARKQFEAEKLNKLAAIAMNTAEGITKAMTIDPTGILAAIVTASGVTQGAIVAQQQFVPMAEGGSGTVTKPTLFLAGEAGAEDFSFMPKRKGGLGGGVTIVQNIGGSIWRERELEAIGMAGMARAGRGY